MQRVNGGTKAEAYRWIAAEFGLVDEKPSSEDRKRWAQKQRAIERANAWRAGEIARLRDEMMTYYRHWKRGLNAVIKCGLDSDMGGFWAGVCECYDPKWMAVEGRIDAIRAMPAEEVIALLDLADSL